MRLYFLRHGIAEDVSSTGLDRDRDLTEAGVGEMKLESAGLRFLDLDLDVIVSSPFNRALQTANIAAHELNMESRLVVDQRVAPGFRLGDVSGILDGLDSPRRVLFVGHNFDLPIIAGQLVGGANIELKKGGLIRVDTDSIAPGCGSLVWVLTPKLLIALGTS